jgi:hypothetical protein
LLESSLKITYTALAFDIAGVSYVADGAYLFRPGIAGPASGGGQVLVMQGQTQVGRIFADEKGLHFEVQGQVVDVR